MNAAIEVSHLTKRYGPVTALDDVTFTVGRGEMYGLIGPDGAGKTTIYRILTALTAPDSGAVKVLGLDARAESGRVRTLIGYMPERFSLYPDLTVMENLRFFASLFGVSVRQNFDLIAPVFGQLSRFPDRRAGRLSGGMKQKLALSCALIHRPRLLLLDEPTTGVDAVSRSEFWDMLAELRSKDITILVSTSYMDEAARCGRIAMIDHGRIIADDTPRRLVSSVGDNLYSARAHDMFRLLEVLRSIPSVTDCYTFGATLHLTAAPDFDMQQVMRRLRDFGIDDAEIFPAAGNLEDLFIKLSSHD